MGDEAAITQSSETEAPKPVAHEDVCHTAQGHAVPGGCTDEHGEPLKG